MLNLNDDCLLYIITFLRRNDQVQLKRVCLRLNNLINLYWRHKYKRWSSYDQHCQGNDSFLWMVYHLHDHIEELNLGCLHTEHMDILGSFVFENTHTLVVDAEIVHTEALNEVPKAFPNLNRIDLVGNISLNVVAEMKYLSELKLDYVLYEGDFRLEPIFTNLKLRKFSFGYTRGIPQELCVNDINTITYCQTLEELSTNAELLDMIAEKLLELKNLRLIGCFVHLHDVTYRNIYDTIIDLFNARIHTLISDSLLSYFPMHILPKMPYLKKWIMKDRFMSRYDKITLEKSLPQLEELVLINPKHIKPINSDNYEMMDEEYLDLNIIELISACKNLKVLGVPLEWLNEELSLKKLYNLLKEQSEWKSHRLIVKCFTQSFNYNNTERLQKSYGDQMNIMVTAYPKEEIDRYTLHYFCERLFEIHFNKPVD
ncbi:uncharacterized protein LOC101460644 [Ceratitis capitata]|uniref:uncharacterized protein LOC101460644 n=1 Tax=Ceratitis capitata TaxID=7213 RepID=UPI0003298C89|nr:uncharacterized protein LOC101460644 [Ceratitis capitata]